MVSNNIFSEDLIFLDKSYASKEEMFSDIGSVLVDKGFVKESYIQALIEREKKYPTGLPITPFAVAIPHTDPQHTIKKSISIVRLNEKLDFYEMGTDDRQLQVKFAFILTLNESTQVPVLKDLMSLFTDEVFMNKLAVYDYEDVVKLIKDISRKEE